MFPVDVAVIVAEFVPVPDTGMVTLTHTFVVPADATVGVVVIADVHVVS